MRAPEENLPSVSRRLKAGRKILDGVPIKQIVDELHLCLQTVRRYEALVHADGLDALKQLKLGGRASALDAEARKWLATALQRPATEFGFESERWSNARVRALIEKQYGVSYSRVYVWEIVQQLGLGQRFFE
ncbi:transposon protein [Caballeronia arvi]|uniref:Transposon protein n=1 Tax=Caballeronia arvi TaxID=1777135 RepID=A0A158KYF8_9BURK|nr:helix-turn-helix domain-containing protein [Caballeronia arvi]SAL86188.1 transposon protein [Caballeronia arvi]